MKNKGSVIVISAPSGGGKTTVVKEVIAKLHGVKSAITCTSRDMRDGEIDGVHYFFFTKEDFENKINQGDFFWEHTCYCGNYYGVPKKKTLETIEAGFDVFLNIESEGMRAVKKTNPDDVVSIFLMPKSLSDLKSRLIGRGDDESVVVKRIANAKAEIANYDQYDYIVFNDKLEDAVTEVIDIIIAERAKIKRKNDIKKFMEEDFFNL